MCASGLVLGSQHYKNPTKRVGLAQSRHRHRLVKCNLL
jgi:hypothetical protein